MCLLYGCKTYQTIVSSLRKNIQALTKNSLTRISTPGFWYITALIHIAVLSMSLKFSGHQLPISKLKIIHG